LTARTPTRYKIGMEPARRIITLLGGDTFLARYLGLHRTAVARWKQPKPHGTAGMVPFRYVPELLALAEQRGFPLTANDFLPQTLTHIPNPASVVAAGVPISAGNPPCGASGAGGVIQRHPSRTPSHEPSDVRAHQVRARD
jgi:hypothetical protein